MYRYGVSQRDRSGHRENITLEGHHSRAFNGTVQYHDFMFCKFQQLELFLLTYGQLSHERRCPQKRSTLNNTKQDTIQLRAARTLPS